MGQLIKVFKKLALFTFCLYFTAVTCERVQYVAIIFRHGDRTPVDPYPNDPWKNESLWPVKFGQLTNIGKEQHYLFGQWIRKNYSYLVSEMFDPAEISVKSTDVDRTLMSAECNLAGLYPPKGKAIWHQSIEWQPISIHTVPEKQDEVLAMKKHCPAYDTEYKTVVESSRYKERLAKYRDLMNFLTVKSGNKIRDYDDINYLYNTLYIETLYNFTLPAWAVIAYGKMREPACFSFRVPTLTPQLARLKVGPLFSQIVMNMHDVINNNKKIKMSMYSAHDITVGNMLNALRIFDGQCPVYTSAVFFELIRDESDDKYYVKVLYRNTTDNQAPIALEIPNCGNRCLYSRFIELYSNLIIEHWNAECNIMDDTFYIFIYIFAIVGALIIAAAVIKL